MSLLASAHRWHSRRIESETALELSEIVEAGFPIKVKAGLTALKRRRI
jgi:hypothetical protein